MMGAGSMGVASGVGLDRPQLLSRSPNYVCGAWHNLFCLVWRGRPTMEDEHDFFRSVPPLIARYPEGIGIVVIIEREFSLPSREVGQMGARQLNSIGAHMRCIAVLIEGDDLRTTLLRPVVRGIALLSRANMQLYVHQNLTDIAGFVAPLLGTPDDVLPMPSRILEAVRTVRSM